VPTRLPLVEGRQVAFVMTEVSFLTDLIKPANVPKALLHITERESNSESER